MCGGVFDSKAEFKKQQHLHPFQKIDEGIVSERDRDRRGEGTAGSTIPVTSLCFPTSCSCVWCEILTEQPEAYIQGWHIIITRHTQCSTSQETFTLAQHRASHLRPHLPSLPQLSHNPVNLPHVVLNQLQTLLRKTACSLPAALFTFFSSPTFILPHDEWLTLFFY